MQTKDIQTIDTNVLLRLAIGDIDEQLKSATRLVLNGATYYIPTQAITEAVFVMEKNSEYRFSRPEIADSLRTILVNSAFLYESKIIDETIDFYLTHPKLSFVDCLLGFETAANGYEPIWTFDQAFAKQSPTAKLIK